MQLDGGDQELSTDTLISSGLEIGEELCLGEDDLGFGTFRSGGPVVLYGTVRYGTLPFFCDRPWPIARCVLNDWDGALPSD